MVPVSRYMRWFKHLWQLAVEPSPTIADPVIRHRIRILNSILVVFIPLSTLTLLIYLLTLPARFVGLPTTILAVLMGMSVAALIYIVNHTRYYLFARYLTVGVGLLAVLANAVASQPPHLEIAYIIMLPLVSTLLFSFKDTLVICLLSVVSFLGFAHMMGDIPADIFKDLLTFIMFIQVFILFLSQQRNRLETDRQKLAIEQERNTLLKKLIASISHDFRTPLTIIITNTYLLGRTTDLRQQQEKRDQIHKQALRLNQFIEDILTMSTLDQNTEIELEQADLNHLLRRLYEEFIPQAKAKNIRLQLDLAPDIQSVQLNTDHFDRACNNLVQNAINYTPAGGQVIIRSMIQRDALVIECIDTGIGISPQDLPQVFTAFFRADHARSTETGGMGLGLAITRQIVEQHGGNITVESVVGQGSTFRIQLPSTQDK